MTASLFGLLVVVCFLFFFFLQVVLMPSAHLLCLQMNGLKLPQPCVQEFLCFYPLDRKAVVWNRVRLFTGEQV